MSALKQVPGHFRELERIAFLKNRVHQSLEKLEELQLAAPKSATRNMGGVKDAIAARIEVQEREVFERLKALAHAQAELGLALMNG